MTFIPPITQNGGESPRPGSPGSTTPATAPATGGATTSAKQAGGGGIGTGMFVARVAKGGDGSAIPQPGPAYPVPHDATVEVLAFGDNTGTVFTALGPEQAMRGPRANHTQTAPVMNYNVGNLADIWVFGAIGDGILMRVMRRGR